MQKKIFVKRNFTKVFNIFFKKPPNRAIFACNSNIYVLNFVYDIHTYIKMSVGKFYSHKKARSLFLPFTGKGVSYFPAELCVFLRLCAISVVHFFILKIF